MRKKRWNFDVGQSTTLPGGTVDPIRRLQALGIHAGQSRPRPELVLVSSVVMMVGLVVSMLVRRRRLWVRLAPDNSGGGDSQVYDVPS